MGLSPGSHCCCCAPKCCGLRAGVLAIAILKIIFGSLCLLQAIWATAVTGATNIPFFPMGWIAFVYFPLGIYLVIVGVVGIRATTPLTAILNLSSEVLKYSKWLWILSAVESAVLILISFISAVYNSVILGQATFEGFLYVPAVIIHLQIWVWLLIIVSITLYLLFVIWSYKEKLHRAKQGIAGAADGLVKGTTGLLIAVAISAPPNAARPQPGANKPPMSSHGF